MKPSCKDCAFFEDNELRPDFGSCLRYPPNIIGEFQARDNFPRVFVLDWCGEFKEGPKE